MKIKIKKLTDEKLMTDILEFMTGNDNIKTKLKDIYYCEHSPIYSQLFLIKMYNIPSFVSVHFSRHEKNGCTHYISSNRSDFNNTNDADINRLTPVNHAMLCNSKHLIDMARKRLCMKASKETRQVMNMIKNEIFITDNALFDCLIPDCLYRGEVCHELKSCGYCKKEKY